MDALIVCDCRHTIAAHENGRCSSPHCACTLGSFTVLDAAIDRIKAEHGTRHPGMVKSTLETLTHA